MCRLIMERKNHKVHTNYQQLVQNFCQLCLANGHVHDLGGMVPIYGSLLDKPICHKQQHQKLAASFPSSHVACSRWATPVPNLNHKFDKHLQHPPTVLLRPNPQLVSSHGVFEDFLSCGALYRCMKLLRWHVNPRKRLVCSKPEYPRAYFCVESCSPLK